MAPSREEDEWSDSDDENLTEIETSVLLGVPDGPVEIGSELDDAAVSRIGGLPVRVLLYRCPNTYAHPYNFEGLSNGY